VAAEGRVRARAAAGLLLAVVAGAGTAAAAPVTVSVAPDSLLVARVPAWFPLGWRLRNAGDAPVEAVAREARFVAPDGGWSAAAGGPAALSLAVPAGGEAPWPDNLHVPAAVLESAAGDSAFRGDAIVFEQTFVCLRADGGVERATGAVRLALAPGWRAEARVERWREGALEAMAPAAWLARGDHRARARALAAFADSARAALAGLLGGDPAAGPALRLRLGAAHGSVGLTVDDPAGGAALELPARVLDDPRAVAPEIQITRDLTLALLAARRPGLPRWLVDGARHHFGNLALDALGRPELARASRDDLARQARAYRELGLDFVAGPAWPAYGREPAFLLGAGYAAWEVLRPLAAEHGARVVAAALACLDAASADLGDLPDESARTQAVVECCGRAAGRDLTGWFAARGIR